MTRMEIKCYGKGKVGISKGHLVIFL